MLNYTLDQLVRTTVLLTAEKNIDTLLEKILEEAMKITASDGGTVYTLEDDGMLHFRSSITKSKNFNKSTGKGNMDIPPVPLERKYVVANAVMDHERINVDDIYHDTKYDFSGAQKYDAFNGYHTTSMMIIPMEDEKGKVNGALQLINAQDANGNAIPFDKEQEDLIAALASLTAVSMNNQKLSADVYDILHSFVQVMVGAIDMRTPYNANHTKSMVRYGEKFVTWLNQSDSEWKIPEEKVDAFLMSIWLHDIGKLITPLEVMDKATRLGNKEQDVMHRISTARLMERIRALEHPEEAEEAKAAIEALNKAQELIGKVNSAGFLQDEVLTEVEEISKLTCLTEEGERVPLFTPEEHVSITVRKGTLTDAERSIMQSHVSDTARMLTKMKFRGDYAQVPAWASAHHELLNGKGYPDHKKGDEIPNEVRILTIIDVYDALTAEDRPYKPPMPVEKAFGILESMRDYGEIDGKILEMFKESKAWEKNTGKTEE